MVDIQAQFTNTHPLKKQYLITTKFPLHISMKCPAMFKKYYYYPLLLLLVIGCATDEYITDFPSPVSTHRSLNRMRSTSVKHINGILRFGESRKYIKHGVPLVILKGTPYEIGYARGILLKDEIAEWVRNMHRIIRKKSGGTPIGKIWMTRRSKAVETFLPEEYREELRGMSDAAEIDYDTLLMVNLLETVAHQFGCTSTAVICSDGTLLRSLNQDGKKSSPYLGSWTLVVYQPLHGNAFISVCAPGFVGVWTGMNEKRLTFGTHNISGARVPDSWKGISTATLNRMVLQYSTTIQDAGAIIQQEHRCTPRMFMVADSQQARNYEYDSKKIVYEDMVEEHLILTNHTSILRYGAQYPHSIVRFEQAQDFLARNQGHMCLDKLVQLNRLDSISWAFHPHIANWNSTIFRPETLDFWTAINPPPASRRKYVGFNLKNELTGNGNGPVPAIIPAIDISKHLWF